MSRGGIAVLTGYNGYLGNEVAGLLAGDYSLVCVGRTPPSRFGPETTWLPFDFATARDGDLLRLLQELGDPLEFFVHAAAITSVPESFRDPALCDMVNRRGTEEVTRSCLSLGARRLVFASSVSVYGSPASLPVSENAGLAPESPYGVSKALGELEVSWCASLGVESVALRLSNIAGVGAAASARAHKGVLPYLAESVVSKLSPELSVGYDTADGSLERDFVNVRDAAAAVVSAMTCRIPESFLAVNVASGEAISLLRAAELLCSASGFPFAPIYCPAREGEVPSLRFDVELAREALGWAPTVPPEDTVSEELFFARRER